MTKWLHINLCIEECTQCGASSGLTAWDSWQEYGHKTGLGLLHVFVGCIPVSVPISMPTLPGFPVALCEAMSWTCKASFGGWGSVHGISKLG